MTQQQATPAENNSVTSDQIQLVTFWVGSEEFAVEILAVREINRMLEITSVPEAPSYVEGVINLRGLIVPIVDIRKRFGAPSKKSDSETRIIVVEVNGRMIGFIVDRVNEVLRLNRDVIDPAPDLGNSDVGQFISGVGKLEDRLIILLDIAKLIADLRIDDHALSNAA
ncbi:MAG: chemotaxis protein CheW [Pseudomonadota bacterium]